MKENAIEVNNVSMQFNLSKEKIDSLKEKIIRKLHRQTISEEFYALKKIQFTVEKGSAFAIIGANGCGKSTLLKIISGIYKPTEGNVIVNGTIAPLIELGAGFDLDLTARENIYLNGSVLGYTRKFMNEKFDEIMNFSELWEFVDVPVKNYSSGMYARLGFSIATIVKPDILIVDEILSVGDASFQKKCEIKMRELIDNGTTLIFVSHDSEQVKKLCQKAIWIKHGEVAAFGNSEEVCEKYLGDM